MTAEKSSDGADFVGDHLLPVGADPSRSLSEAR
jgi:hypothetical protein